jgi:IstB-like ATP binding protein
MPKTLATATVDRLLHHAHLCMTSGDSVRLSQASAGKGVVPLVGEQFAAPARPEVPMAS